MHVWASKDQDILQCTVCHLLLQLCKHVLSSYLLLKVECFFWPIPHNTTIYRVWVPSVPQNNTTFPRKSHSTFNCQGIGYNFIVKLLCLGVGLDYRSIDVNRPTNFVYRRLIQHTTAKFTNFEFIIDQIDCW